MKELTHHLAALLARLNQQDVTTIRNGLEFHLVRGQSTDDMSIDVIDEAWHCIAASNRKQRNIASQDENRHMDLFNEVVVDPFMRGLVSANTKYVQRQ